MTKFKALVSPNQFFSFKNEMYECVNWLFETDNEELINFLKQNVNFELIEDAKTVKK